MSSYYMEYDQSCSFAATARRASAGAIVLALVFGLSGCSSETSTVRQPEEYRSMVNTDHLDRLGEDVISDSGPVRIIHIYSEAPDYHWVGDDDEGVAAVDDAARAAVFYLRHFDATGEETSRRKAERLLRFLLYMQKEDGLFFNFVLNSGLEINRVHQNSLADDFGWWAARAIWAMGTGALVLKEVNPELSAELLARADRATGWVKNKLARFGETITHPYGVAPLWLLHETAADATSELLLGLAALQEAYPDSIRAVMIDQLATGVEMMQYGSMGTFPYGAHASWLGGWHAWGNSQSEALSALGRLDTPVREATHFYPRLLVSGWLHSLPLDGSPPRRFEQIAYGVRCVAAGLIRLYEKTRDERYAIMGGLAASWFTGNNVAGQAMYDPGTGRGFDGINGPRSVNRNAGAESTIEALLSIHEVEKYEAARRWLHASGGAETSFERDGKRYMVRVYHTDDDSAAVLMDLTDEELRVLVGAELTFLEGVRR
jgi:hypothetical protein